MAAIRRIVLATANPHKLDELRPIFAAALPGLELIGLNDLTATPPEPHETGQNFNENAIIKAVAYAHATGELCLADDSGLEIDALDGRPGVISSHYCTDGKDVGMSRAQRDLANTQRVLREMEGIAENRRGARFVCVMALARRESLAVLAVARGTFEGRIGLPVPAPNAVPRGQNGFGYDPIFVLPAPDQRTSAELDPAEKNVRSHRAAAAHEMARLIRLL